MNISSCIISIFLIFLVRRRAIAAVVLRRTRVGLNLRAVGENPATADAVGINVNAYKYGAILIGSAIAGLGGLLYVMEYNTGTPIYLQVINELKKKMVKGELKPGEKMPSSRDLAVAYKVNQNTAARIYREMEMAGYCFTRRGIGTFVSEEENMFQDLKKEMADELLKNFMHEMSGLGYQKDDIISQIADYKEDGENDA